MATSEDDGCELLYPDGAGDFVIGFKAPWDSIDFPFLVYPNGNCIPMAYFK